MSYSRRLGFTLFEMALVLTIIALIIGGILVARDMIEGGQQRSLINEIKQIESAVGTFHDKYNGLPGDMLDATTIWGALAGGGGCPDSTTAPTTTQTCDGDGSGTIEDGTAEPWRFWQHLGNADLIWGKYNVAFVDYWFNSYPGTTVPESKAYKGVGFAMFSLRGYIDGRWFSTFDNMANQLYVGNPHATTHEWVGYPAFKGKTALNIDQKMDDGFPGQGNLQTMTPYGGYMTQSCATTTVPTTARYNLTTTGLICSFIFKMSWSM